jgi:hypothetical protein
MRGKPSEKPANQGNPTFLFRIVKFADLTGVKSDRLLVRHEVACRSCSHFNRREPPVSPGESRSLNKERL